MINHTLISLLKSFTKSELKEFRKFLASPYYNKRTAVIKLYDILISGYPEFDKRHTDEMKLFSGLADGKKCSGSYLTVLMHYLYELCKKYITLNSIENNFPEYRYFQLSELHRRKHFTDFEKTIDYTLEIVQNTDYVAEQFYFHKFRLKYEKLFYLSQYNTGEFEKILEKAGFENLFDDLTLYYYFISIRLYLNILNLEKIYKREFEKGKFEKMISGIDAESVRKNPLLNIYHNLLMMITSEDEYYYFNTKKILSKILPKLNYYDLSEVYINLLNFCTRKILSGNMKFVKEKFEVCKDEIKAGTYKINGVMSPVYYRQVVSTGLQLRSFKWVINFIEEFKTEIEPDKRQNTYLYCNALCSFRMNDYGKALEYISKIKFKELYQKVDVKILQMMIYYETEEMESLYSSLEAYRHFLANSNLISLQRKKYYMDFYRYLKRLTNIKIKKSGFEIEKFRQSLNNNKAVPNIDWLNEKTDELKNLLSHFTFHL